MKNLLWKKSACEVVDSLEKKDIKPSEVLVSLYQRCNEVNKKLNALPTIFFDQAIEKSLKDEKKSHLIKGNFFGLPIPIKDSYPVKNIRTTYGSLAFENFIPNWSDLIVHKIESSGGIIYAKSNTPEFEAGANTFNEVFGKTVNPWSVKLSAGGSSGGAAAAVASGMAFIAQGSDFACSVRYPASFCGIVGIRPTPGLIPQGPNKMPYQSLSVIGPLARNIEDLGLALDGMFGYSKYDPMTNPFSSGGYRKAAKIQIKPKTIAFSEDLDITPVSKQVRETFLKAINIIANNGVNAVKTHPDFKSSQDAFYTLRAFQFSTMWGDVLKKHSKKLKPEVAWNIKKGFDLKSDELASAENSRLEVRNNLLKFLDKYDFLITPSAPVVANPVEERFVREIDGHKLENYIDWLALGYAISITGCPAISIPCGFSEDGLPIGLQIIGKPYSEKSLLSFSSLLENIFNISIQKPIDPIEKS